MRKTHVFAKNAYLCESRIPHSLLPSCLLAGFISDNSQRPPSLAALRWLRKTWYSVTSTGRAAPIAKENILLSSNDHLKKHARIQNHEIACGSRKRHDFYDSCPIGPTSIFMNPEEHFTIPSLCLVLIKRLSFLFFMTPKEILATPIFLPSTGSGIS